MEDGGGGMVYAHVEVFYARLVGDVLRTVLCVWLVGDCLCVAGGGSCAAGERWFSNYFMCVAGGKWFLRPQKLQIREA